MASAVSGMLSNTAETKPRPSVVAQDGVGNAATGISEAHHTSASRNRLPLKALGSRFQLGGRYAASSSRASATARPITGNFSSIAGSRKLNHRLLAIAASSTRPTTTKRPGSICAPGVSSFWIGW